MTIAAYPLSWPDSWPRTPDHLRKNSAPFKMHSDRVRRELFAEIRRMGGSGLVISSNIAIRGDGMPYADAARRKIGDPGVAIFFVYKGKPTTMARDVFWKVEDNLTSLLHVIQHIRGLERHGGGAMMERAFAGFTALPPPEGFKPKRPWWEVLGYSADPADRALLSVPEIDARGRSLAKKRHPDGGGSAALFDELQVALEDARKDFETEA